MEPIGFTPNRRSLLTGALALVCAPAIVRASSLMPVRPFYLEPADALAFSDSELVAAAIAEKQRLMNWAFREMLRHAEPTLILEKFGQGKPMPANNTVATFRRPIR